MYAYVYDQLLIFPRSEIEYETITTNKVFLHIYQFFKGKVHLHHSHITGEIIGYTHDFCDTRVIEKSNGEIPFIAHNFFGFDLFYFLKTYVAAAWCTKEVNNGVNHLTRANYGNINDEINLIDSLRFYQKSLSQLSSTMTNQEKTAVKNVAEKFLNCHYYFSTVWPYLPVNKKNKVLEITAEGNTV